MIINGKRLDCALAADNPDFRVDSSLVTCDECGEICLFLGTLGNVRHYLCRYCGLERAERAATCQTCEGGCSVCGDKEHDCEAHRPRTTVVDTVGDLEAVRTVAGAFRRITRARKAAEACDCGSPEDAGRVVDARRAERLLAEALDCALAACGR